MIDLYNNFWNNLRKNIKFYLNIIFFLMQAEIAGKISIKQFELALRLRDPFLVARCKLYIALSLIQQGQLKTPKQIVKHIYKFSINQNDIRLQNMCQGIWAKLKYCYKIQKERHKT